MSPIDALLLVGVLLVLVLVAVLVFRRTPGEREAGLLQQQLVELRGRLDALSSAQRDVPRALAEGSAAQMRVLADVHERLGELGAAARRLETMGETVSEVQQLLQVPKLRGTLGEVWLEELLRQILPPAHFRMQHRFSSGERVDAVVTLGDRLVPVDAKFPLEACQRLLAAATPEDAERERRTFGRSLRDRIDEIADKYIRPDEGTYDFALMYIPAENVYYEAVLRAQDPADGRSALGHALRRRVIPVSPHTLYAYLLVILHGLKGMAVERRAREIRDRLGALRQQFDALWAAIDRVGVHLGNAQKQLEEGTRHAGRVRDRLDAITSAALEPGEGEKENGGG